MTDRRTTILHLEDDPNDAELVAAALVRQQIDARVLRARTKPEFLAALKAGRFELILADFRLPGFDGMEALELAKQLAPGIPFIFVSSTMGEHLAVEGLKNGAVDFVLKSALFRLPAAVSRALAEAREAESLRRMESSRRQLIEILEATPDYVGTSTADGRTLYINRSFRELIGGATLEELHGRPITSFHPPQMRERLLHEALPEVRRSGFWQGENELLDAAGRAVPVFQSAVAHRDAAGQITHLSTIMRDISALKANEAALHNERGFLRSVLDAMGSRIAILDERGSIVAVNQRWVNERCCLLGEAAPVGGDYLGACRGTSGRGGRIVAAGIEAVLGGEVRFQVEHRCNGGRRWFRINVTRFEQMDGQVFAVVAYEDITERVSATAELQQQHHLMRAVAASTHQLTCVIEPDGAYASIGRSLPDGSAGGRSADTLLGALFPGDRRKGLAAYLRARRGHIHQLELRLCWDQSSERVLRVTFHPLREGSAHQGAGSAPASTGMPHGPRGNTGLTASDRVVVVAEDITEVKALGRQLIQAGKLATLGEMATGVAHELNQPLAVVRLAAEMIGEELDAQNPSAEFLRTRVEKIRSMATRAENIIRQLRLFARGAEPYFRPTDVADAISDMLELVSGRLQSHGVTLLLDVAEGLPPVRGDATQLGQVFLNLALNAIYAMSEGQADTGRKRELRIRARTIEQPPTKDGASRQREAMSARTFVAVEFEDNGTGLSPEALEKAFEPFFSTKPPGSGTGLGLSISFGIIQSHGGTITAENTGKGALFRTTIPALPADQKDDSPDVPGRRNDYAKTAAG